ncbi:Crp/Fnr family transcriptional regulator [Pararhodobacter sp. SW119]|uniref:Crp/Fnr family transcriptional regulator n=1 Tax=Pararhodobacter sp. SW119 TaxID=2780075 RepID=UPI001FD77A4F|nr:Crp/Fnr family transcriptional regulator [Pararhodobacter sp. SW119]
MLEPHFEPVDLPLRYVLERPKVAIEHVYFPLSGLASIVALAGRDKQVEVGIFGGEGMSGTAIVLENDTSPYKCFMQIGGEGLRVRGERLRKAMDESPTLRAKFLRYANYMSVQTTQTAVANTHSQLEERLCRWLLMCHDRMGGDKLGLTHEFLSTMLGVRRAGVTLAVHILEGRGLIRATRGCIEIVDREGLEVCADGIYGLAEAEYARLFGVSPREWLS